MIINIFREKPGILIICAILFVIIGISVINDSSYRCKNAGNFIFTCISNIILSLITSLILSIILFFVGSLFCTALIPHEFEVDKVYKLDKSINDEYYTISYNEKGKPIYNFLYTEDNNITVVKSVDYNDIEIKYDDNCEPAIYKLNATYIFSPFENTFIVMTNKKGFVKTKYRLCIPRPD